MRRIGSGLVVAALVGAAFAVATPAAAEFVGARTTHDLSAQTSRPRVTIYPRRQRLSASSVRQCRSQLVKEYRPSGTVIVPKTQCWWE